MSAIHPLTSFIQPIYFDTVDFGTLGTYSADSFRIPCGYENGRVLDVGIMGITETFACDSTTAKVRVGTTGDADKYCELIITDGTAVTDTFTARDDADAIKDENIYGVSVSQIEVSFVASADTGTAAGVAKPYIIIEWF